mmetsp:Transcript_13015/g.36517  ORF Transcript_13015/g.36517 Transcript_13015/m.36517 type:complete len:265 (+) Transcript_13015:502-1296(+)
MALGPRPKISSASSFSSTSLATFLSFLASLATGEGNAALRGVLLLTSLRGVAPPGRPSPFSRWFASTTTLAPASPRLPPRSSAGEATCSRRPSPCEGAWSKPSFTSRGTDSLPVERSSLSSAASSAWVVWLAVSWATKVVAGPADDDPSVLCVDASAVAGPGSACLGAAGMARLLRRGARAWCTSFTLSSTLLQCFLSFLSRKSPTLPRPFFGFFTKAISLDSSFSRVLHSTLKIAGLSRAAASSTHWSKSTCKDSEDGGSNVF